MSGSTKQQILTQLMAHPDEWLSGDQLAQQVGISRESVWKAINALRKRGHQIDSRKNRGYQYAGSRQLDALAIKVAAGSGFTGPIEVATTTASTQYLAKQSLSRQAQPQVAAFLADQQTAGYGRLGRTFYSPAQTGLYFSLVLPNPTNDLSQVGLLTTGVVVSVVKVLQRFFPTKDFGLKWVNDIFLNQHKVGGIITEASMELESTSTAAFIVGVGLNLTTKDFPTELTAIAQGIAPTASVDRNQLAAALLVAINAAYQQYPSTALLPFYREKSVILGRPVTLQVGQRAVTGIADTIDDRGGLVLTLPTGQRESFTSGEVTRVR
ncbi:biotin--[acetyl-CoA-carboxylase] ligase [Lactiplantibacillus garii]|uniref:Bifunctional ligase/repressor BirA n=1 Tax=Lactiplantibacillus garii TaxID=2306423 RepID=A0A3R8KG75_9LACO|nr:biotin--[acetyl-CoA-carboxylase] ligase [Lactiplantibacillus garii]RRK11256.1 biotin--[acetyl-CoA-carboxylase] ligase [Lactiplantibacillus garii]